MGNGLAVIGGQTVPPAIGGVAVGMGALHGAEGSQSEGIGLLFQNIAPAVVGIGIALIGVFVVLTDQLSQLVIGVLIIHRAALGNGLTVFHQKPIIPTLIIRDSQDSPYQWNRCPCD